jgi:hypothetical protein
VIVKLGSGEVPGEESQLPTVRGVAMNFEIEGQENYPTTDVSYEIVNAEGQVTLYNETGSPKTLVPSRLMAPGGEIFRFDSTVTIPARGSLVVNVKADPYDISGNPIGKRGNIAAGTRLNFPALKPQNQELYYAMANLGPFVKGDTLRRYFLGEEDREGGKKLFTETYAVRASEKLNEEIIARAERDKAHYELIKSRKVQGVELLDYAFPEELIGTEQDSYTVSGRVKISGLVFDREQVVSALRQQLQLNLNPDMKLLEIDPTSLDYQVINAEQTEKGWVKMSASMIGLQVLDLKSQSQEAEKWKQNLKRKILGKPRPEVRKILGNYPEVEEVLNLSIKPFWALSLPIVEDQIEIQIHLDEPK